MQQNYHRLYQQATTAVLEATMGLALCSLLKLPPDEINEAQTCLEQAYALQALCDPDNIDHILPRPKIAAIMNIDDPGEWTERRVRWFEENVIPGKLRSLMADQESMLNPDGEREYV